jgi:hypothetical protein
MGNRDRRIQAHPRQLQALELRLAGATYDEIAERLGYASRSGAFNAVDSALKLTKREPAEGVRRLSAERLDRATLAIWRKVSAGDLHAIDVLLRVESRRAKLLGLDAPQQLEHSGPGGSPLAVSVEQTQVLAQRFEVLVRQAHERLTTGES